MPLDATDFTAIDQIVKKLQLTRTCSVDALSATSNAFDIAEAMLYSRINAKSKALCVGDKTNLDDVWKNLTAVLAMCWLVKVNPTLPNIIISQGYAAELNCDFIGKLVNTRMEKRDQREWTTCEFQTSLHRSHPKLKDIAHTLSEVVASIMGIISRHEDEFTAYISIPASQEKPGAASLPGTVDEPDLLYPGWREPHRSASEVAFATTDNYEERLPNLRVVSAVVSPGKPLGTRKFMRHPPVGTGIPTANTGRKGRTSPDTECSEVSLDDSEGAGASTEGRKLGQMSAEARTALAKDKSENTSKPLADVKKNRKWWCHGIFACCHRGGSKNRKLRYRPSSPEPKHK